MHKCVTTAVSVHIMYYELSGEKIRAFRGFVTMLTKGSLKDTSRIWRRIYARAIRGGSYSASSP